MTTRRATLLLHDFHGTDAGEKGIQHAIESLPGVVRAHVNPATEMVYVEYDDARCSRAQLRAALDATRPGDLNASPSGREDSHPMQRDSLARRHAEDTTMISRLTRTVLTTLGLLGIVGFLVATEHGAHFLGVLPFLILLACPFLHLFMHGGHGRHGEHGHPKSEPRQHDRASPAARAARVGHGPGREHPP